MAFGKNEPKFGAFNGLQFKNCGGLTLHFIQTNTIGSSGTCNVTGTDDATRDKRKSGQVNITYVT